jgi:hypothetical protein
MTPGPPPAAFCWGLNSPRAVWRQLPAQLAMWRIGRIGDVVKGRAGTEGSRRVAAG